MSDTYTASWLHAMALYHLLATLNCAFATLDCACPYYTDSDFMNGPAPFSISSRPTYQ